MLQKYDPFPKSVTVPCSILAWWKPGTAIGTQDSQRPVMVSQNKR